MIRFRGPQLTGAPPLLSLVVRLALGITMTDQPAKRSGSRLLLVLALLFAASFGCCGIVGGLSWYAVATYEVLVMTGNGMYPNAPDGSRVIALRKPYADASQVQRGDVVIISRVEAGAEIKYIWRVVGLPGDRIQTSLKSVSVNGKPLPLDQLRVDGEGVIFTETNGAAQYEVRYEDDPKWLLPEMDLVVPGEQYFVLGDNRHHAARDSRTIGPVPFKEIAGKKR